MKKKLMMAVAMLAVVLVVRGNAFGECIWSCSFEGTAAGAHLTGSEEVQGHYIYSGYGDDDESVVETHSSGTGKYLGLETEGGTTWFSVLTLKDDKLGGYFEPDVGSFIDVDAMMMFTLTEDTPSFSDMPDMLVGEQPANANVLSSPWKRHEGDMLIIISRGMSMFIDDKISIGRYVDDVTTNWCVLAGMDGDGGAVQGAFTLAAANPSESLPDSSKQEWIRVTVRALNDGSEHGIGFEIYMNGIKAAANGKSVFRAVTSASNRTGVAAVGLRGTGGIDDLSFTSTMTNLIAPEIRNVTAKQWYPWNGLVDITCEVSGIDGAANGLYFTAAAVDTDAGTTNNVTHLWVVQNGIKTKDREVHTNGTYQLLWDAQAELGAILCSNMVMRVNLKEHKSVQLWENGLYWADTNIGAVEPWEYGYYFWWGDTIGYTCENGQWLTNDGSPSTFSFGSANTPTYGKGTADLQSEGWIAAGNTLVLGHDAAHVLWGGNWRMPTMYEFNDLLANCDWNWMTINGVNGYVVRGRGSYSSNSIFLPAAGYGSDTSLDNAGSQGYYWSATSCYREHTDDYHDSWSIIFGSVYYGADYFSRYFAQSVRPVQGFAGAVVGTDRAADSVPFLLDTVTCATCGDDLYCVIDLTDGPNATAYPISYLTDVPSGGWTDEYKTTKLVLRKIDAGTFDAAYYSSTVLSKPFYIGVFEVTQQQYELVMGDNPCSVTSYGKGDNYPVHYISYNDIRGSVTGASWPISATVDRISFLGKIQSRTGIDFDLPTEAQWQYACRAGTTTAFSFGDEEDGRYMWSSVNSSSTSHPVGMKSPNAWGLYDMHGNVWEWCLDWWSSTGTGGTYTDPTGPLSGVHRLLHGGSWHYHSSYGMSSNVLDEDPSVRSLDYGFRLCCTGELNIKTADEVRLEGVLAGLPVEVEPNDEGGWKVTITNDVNGADLPIEIPDNVGAVTIDLNGHDLLGGDGNSAIRIVADVGNGDPTVLTVITTSGDATIQGGYGAPATEVVVGAQDGAAFNFGEGVIVRSGIKLEIRNVTARQRYPWNGLVDITCEVSGIDGTTNGLKFAVAAVDADSGTTNKVLHFWVVQDETNSTDYAVHTNGDYRFVWDAKADLGQVIHSNMVARVTLIDAHGKVQLWEGGPYWADTNIGADAPWKYGYYFWWGNTIGYKRENDAWAASDGSSSNFSFGNAPSDGKGITRLQREGWITVDGVLAPELDAVRAQWDDGWRMPTKQNLDDLNNKCDWTWTTINGVNGYVVRGRGDYASNCIFLPCAGYGDGTSLGNVGLCGYYWSTLPASDNYYGSWDLCFGTDSHTTESSGGRSYGFSIRPVQGFIEAVVPMEQAGDSAPFLLDTVTSAACGDDLYCVIDLTGGPDATSYPVSYLAEVPSGGWTDEYKTTKLVLRKIEPGTFMMGGTVPTTITKAFYMGVFEVTQRQWELVMGTRPSYFNNTEYYAMRPVECVSYEDIRGSRYGYGWPTSASVDKYSFLGYLQLRTGTAIDLPTEAQWEYSCRAGMTNLYNNGGCTADDLEMLGRYCGNGGSGLDQNCTTATGTAAVGSYLSNAWGLYDMHGNVWEWCLDCFSYTLEGGIDPVGPIGVGQDQSRVQRGGGLNNRVEECTSSCREQSGPAARNIYGGFRLCCGVPVISSDIAGADVVLVTDQFIYAGNACEPEIESVTFEGTALVEGVDYLFLCSNNTNAGLATITLTGINLFTGTYTTNFTIRPKPLTEGMVEAIGNHPYTGRAQTPNPTVMDAERGATLREGVEYTLSYANNTAIGEGIVTVKGKGNYTGSVARYFVIESSEGSELEERLGGTGKVESDDEGGWIVTLTNNVDSANLPLEILDDLGQVTVDLNGHDLVGNDGCDGARPSQDAGEDGKPAIRIVPGERDGEPTVLTIVSTGGDAMVKGGDGGVGNPGGNGAPAIEVVDGTQDGVLINIGTGVTVQGGDEFTQAIIGDMGINKGTIIEPSRYHIPGTGKVTVPKTWKVGQKVTWKATADKGSVFAHWEGPLVDSLNLTKNERRNPSLAFAVPEGFTTNQITAVFISIDDDKFYSLGITQTEFKLKETVSDVLVTDDSQSYVTATVSGLPAGLKFDAKTMRITGAPTKSGVYWVQIKAKNASGYQWAENVQVTVLGGGTEAKEPKLARTEYHPLTVVSVDNAEGTASGTGVYAEGKKVTVSAKPAKGYVFAGWYRDAMFKNPMKFANGDFRKASQSVVMPEVRYLFARFVAATTATDPIVGLAAKGRGLSGDGRFSWRVGVSVPEGDGVAFGSASLPSASAAKLPPGVKFDSADGIFTGVPTKAGTYTASVTVKNASKSTDVLDLVIDVAPLDAWAQGTFDGASWESGVSSTSPNGLATLTVGVNGKISGKLQYNGLTWTLSAPSFSAVTEEADGISYHAAVVGKSGKSAITNEVTVTSEAGARDARPYQRGVATAMDGNLPAWTAWQNMWKTEPWKTEAKAFAKATPLEIQFDDGVNGTITLKFTASGTVVASGKFVTGKDANGKDLVHAATCSAVLIPDVDDAQDARKYRTYLYFAPKAGKFDGYAAEITLVWSSDAFSAW